MSFQHFRLGEMAMSNPPPHLMHLHSSASNIHGHPEQNEQTSQYTTIDNTSNSFSNDTSKISSNSSKKQPYGSGDQDDGYTLVFPNLVAFHEWRQREEETQVVEFVKGDTHGSKAIPPRFKDHTKLVCARHSRSGRKKYVKKHPERVRKVPSRKLEGQGCPASISFKTYYETEEVRACYNSQHSHEIGSSNLPFTRRGRKAAAEAEKGKSDKHIRFANESSDSPKAASASSQVTGPPTTPQPQSTPSNNYSSAVFPPTQATSYQSTPQSYNYQPQYQYTANPAPAPAPAPAPTPTSAQHAADGFNHDRWQNMETLFQSVRETAQSPSQPVLGQQPMAAPMRMDEEASSDET